MTIRISKRLLLGAAAAIGFAPQLAHAQQSTGEGAQVQEVVITGSRIRRDTFDSPVPLSTVSAAAIQNSGRTSLGEILLELPSVDINTNSRSSSATLFNSGQARADIRGLGATRTLVLMDGRRIVYSDASSPAVDLNLIPNLMIERVDVVPGGGSAVYGSEAIAGVVNIIMRKHIEGVEADLQTGITGHNDGQENHIGVVAGHSFLDDRLSVLVGGEWSRVEPIFQRSREELYPGIRRNTNVSPQTIIPASRSNTTPYATFQLKSGALGTAIAYTRDVRDPSQIVRLSPECSTPTVQPTCQDPSLFYTAEYNVLQGRTTRGIVRGYTEYKVTDDVTAFLDASYAKVDGYGYFQPSFSTATGGGTLPLVITGDNAFLNGNTPAAAQLRAGFAAAGLTLSRSTRVPVAKFFEELGGRDSDTRRHTTRIVGGMNGNFDWLGRRIDWDWYAQYGETAGTTRSPGVLNIQKTLWAADAVNVNGQTVCYATTQASTAAAAAGCVPYDLVNGPSQAAIDYINASSTTTQVLQQTVAAVNFTTDLFTLPAGKVGVALGGEYRKEKSKFVQDPLGASGALFFNAIGTRAGEYDVKEGYGEIRVPLLAHLPFADELSVEAAGRWSSYSTIGNTHQYRYAGNWAPFRDIRFRVSQATAVRAPNIVELFSPQSVNFTTAAIDPCDKASFAGATAAQQAARRVTCAAAIPNYNPATFVSNIGTGRPSLELRQGGNPDLGPETAHTWGAGVVVEPRWVPGFSFSIDWFKYNIANQIGTIPVNTLLQQLCYDSSVAYASNPFCSLIVRDPSGAATGIVGGVTRVILTNQNVAKVKVEGYDASVQYILHTRNFATEDLGDVTFRLDVTREYQNALQGLPGQSYTQQANLVGLPEWKGFAQIAWSWQKWNVQLAGHYLGSQASTSAFLPSQLVPYYTGANKTYDVRVHYDLSSRVALRGGILNFTDQYPPYLPETFTGTGSSSAEYDNRGRFFYLGAQLKY